MQSRLYDTDYVVKTVIVPTSRQVWINDSQWDQQELHGVNGARPCLCVCWLAPLVHWRSRPDSQTPSGMSVEERQATVLELLVTSSLKYTLSPSTYIHTHGCTHATHMPHTYMYYQTFQPLKVFMRVMRSWNHSLDHHPGLVFLTIYGY